MAVTVYRDQKIWLDGLDLTGKTNAIGLEVVDETDDNTTFGDQTRSNIGGLTAVTASIEGLADPDTADQVLFNAVGINDKPLSFGADGNQGSVAYIMPALIGSYSPEGEVGRLFRFSAAAASRAVQARGTIMENLVGLTASADGTGRQLGALSATQKLYAALHILAVDNPADTIDVIVESAPTNTFAAATTRITFAQAGAVGGQWGTPPVAGPVTDTWWRIVSTIAGATPAFDLAAIFAIR